MTEALQKYERQLEIMKAADREKELEVNEATVRGVILHTIVGNREATRELYNELADFTKYSGKYRQVNNVISRIYEFCLLHTPAESGRKGHLGNVDEGGASDGESVFGPTAG